MWCLDAVLALDHNRALLTDPMNQIENRLDVDNRLNVLQLRHGLQGLYGAMAYIIEIHDCPPALSLLRSSRSAEFCLLPTSNLGDPEITDDTGYGG